MLGSLKRIARLTARRRERNPRVEWLEHRELLTAFAVTSAADSGRGSLREAIQLANADNTIGADTISFAIGTGGTQTIALQSALPAIARSVAIDGTTQPGPTAGSTAPTIVIDGTNAGAGANGLTLTGTTGGSAVRGLSIVNFRSATDGSGGRAILVNDGGGDTFLGNYLGVAPDGTTARPNAVGIEIQSPNNIVGGVFAGDTSFRQNLISGNTADGVLLSGSRATGNQITGNRVGTDVNGQFALGNLHGVTIASASNNVIGGAATGAGNLISGNAGPQSITGIGVYVYGASSGNVISGNEIGTNLAGSGFIYNTYGIYLSTLGGATSTDAVSGLTIGTTGAGGGNLISGNGVGIGGNLQSSLIAGNLIGTDRTGTKAIGNGSGIFIGTTNTTIGGTTVATRNIIASSGLISSGGVGISLTGDTNKVLGNYIGTDAAGTKSLPNQVGLALHTSNSVIGGTTAGAGNLIAGNLGSGITLDNRGNNQILGNRIGTDPTGAALGNGANGISVALTALTDPTQTLALNDTIGGTAAGAANIITDNTGAGVALTANGVIYSGLSIRGNEISANGKLGISLGGTPSVPNPGTLTLTSSTSTTANSTVQGVLGGLPGQTYQVDVYNNLAADPSGHGEGRTYVGTIAVVIGPGGLSTFSQTFPTPLGANPILTATATDLLGTTSEFSIAFPNNLAQSDLAISQTVSAPSVTSNGIITFTATITNTGSTTANNVVYTDSLPLSLVNATVSSTVGTVTRTNDNIVLARLGDLAPGATVTVTISANASANGSFNTTAGVIGTTPDADYTNNLATQTFTVGPSQMPMADLGIAINPSSATPTVGSPFTYVVTVTNAGPTDATGVSVNDFLPTGVTLVNATASQGGAVGVQGNLITSNLGAIAAGASATLTLTVRPTTAGSLLNSANVSGAQLDPIATNNAATSTINAGGSSPTNGNPLLTLTQSLIPTAPRVGLFEIYTLTVRNVGTADATGVILVDALPGNVTYGVSGSSQGSQPTFANNVVTSNLGTIPAGGFATLTLVVVPNSFATGQVNFAGVVATGANPTAPVFSTLAETVANGPIVTAVNGSRSNGQLVVKFSEPITPASATTRSNYRLYDLGFSPRAVTGADRPIAFTTAFYNPTTQSVTLTPSRAIRSNRYYALVIIGGTRNGITDTSGRKLVGTAGGAAGTNYANTFFAGTLAQV